MNIPIKGPIAMILAGAVTFSVINAFLVDHSSKRLSKENSLTLSAAPKKTNVIRNTEKTLNHQTPKTNVKEGQTRLSQDIPALKVVNTNTKSNRAVKVIKQNTKKFSQSTTTNTANMNEKTTTAIRTTTAKAPAATKISRPTVTNTKSANPTTTVVATKPAASEKPPATTTPTTTSVTNTKSAATTTANPGQQVSQAAKEKAAIRRDQKENNGKKM